MKSYAKLAYTLILFGMGIFMFERFGLQGMRTAYPNMHIDGNLLGILVIAPVVLVLAGCVVFMIGRMRRIK